MADAIAEMSVRTQGKGLTPRTMLDTPLVRGERGVFVPVAGGVRVDMALGRKEMGRNEYQLLMHGPCALFKALICTWVDVLHWHPSHLSLNLSCPKA
jgi:hypothetical protein